MIYRKNYVWTLFLAFLLAACGDDGVTTAVYENAYPLAVTAQNVGFDSDKAAELYLKGENIGVSMLEEGTDKVVEPYFNVRFNSGGIGNYFIVGNNDSLPMFPSDGENRDLAAYYPRVSEVVDNQINIDLTTEQEAAFKLQFDRINSLNKDNREANFKLEHVFAMISAEIAPEVSYSKMVVEVKNTPLKGSLNVLNGMLTGGETGTLVLTEMQNTVRARQISSAHEKFMTMLFPVQNQEMSAKETTSGEPVSSVAPVMVITLLDANNTPIAEPIELNVTDYIATLPSAINTKFEIAIDVNFVPTVKVTSYPITVDDWEVSGELGVEGNEQLEY